jgi:hypothetical protein
LKYLCIILVIVQSFLDAAIELIVEGLINLNLGSPQYFAKLLICFSVPIRLIVDSTIIYIAFKNFRFFSHAYEKKLEYQKAAAASASKGSEGGSA